MTRSQCGFTFLEVLIALTILAVAGVGMLLMINNSQRTMSESRRMVEASMLANQKLFELERDGVSAITDRRGEFDDHPGLAWQARAHPTYFDGLYRLRLAIGSPSGDEEYVIVEKAFHD